MKRKKKLIITIISLVVAAIIGIFVYYNYFYDANKLNISEKEWINDNKSNIVSFNVPSDLNVFGKDGKGVFYDYLDELSNKYDINVDKKITPISGGTGIGFAVKKDITDNDLLFYQDHYVIIGRDYEVVTSITDLNGKTIGGLADGISRVNSSYKTSITFSTYETKDKLLAAMTNKNINYMIIPLNEYLDEIITNNYNIIYHLDNLVLNYYIKLGDNEKFNSIVKKFYNIWSKENLETSYYTNLYNLYVEKLGLTELETDTLTNKVYTFGFVNSTPYQTLSSSKYGGMIIEYLKDFSKFSKVEFKYNKYKNYNALIKAFNNNKVDLIFNDTSLTSGNHFIKTNINEKFYIISPLKDNHLYNDLSEISNETIYVIENSELSKYLKTKNNINLEEVTSEKNLLKQVKKGSLIALDATTYEYYQNKKIDNYYVSYTGYTTDNYTFKYVNNTDTFYKLFKSYINRLSSSDMLRSGLLSYEQAETNGNTASTIAKYALIIITFSVAVIGIVIYSKKHIKMNSKIRKDEKLKYVDMLTSLKNRNYLNERMDIWNQNTIYPQAIIVIDLNNIKYLNDTFGHEEGDKQIMAAANILHQTQLDNTEIMRTDGNEFMIYLVGYQEKQVINYLKKLVKEFNDLPYEYGAAFGFSMIVDDLKLIDDAINEATIQMRENKEIEAESNEEKEIL